MNIFEDWQIGEPVKIKKDGNYIYGRVYKNDSTSSCFEGRYARLFFITPAGSIFIVGRAYMEKLTSEEIEVLKYWEYIQMKQEDNNELYDNKIILENNVWQINDTDIVRTSEMQYEINDNIVNIQLKRKKVPIKKYFGNIPYVEKLTQEILSEIINETLMLLKKDESYKIVDFKIEENIEIAIENPNNHIKIQKFITTIQEKLRDYYEKNAVHITRMFGSYILLEIENETLKATKATPIPIKYCPLMQKLLKEVGGDTAEKLLETLKTENEEIQTKMMCNLINEVVIKGGYFDTNRPLNSCEANVLFGTSETISSAFNSNLVDAAVIVSNNLGTIITTNSSNTQGAVKRMTGLFYTSPSSQIMNTAIESSIIPVFPYTAMIDQIAGVKKAIELGYKNIAVTLAANDNCFHQQLRDLELKHNVTIYKFGLCSTGIDNKTAIVMKDNADVIWSCASKQIREHVEPNSIAQIGIKIPVHVMTKNGWQLIKNHLLHMKNQTNLDNISLTSGLEKPIFANDKDKIKVLKKKDLHNCSDCPSPCV